MNPLVFLIVGIPVVIALTLGYCISEYRNLEKLPLNPKSGESLTSFLKRNSPLTDREIEIVVRNIQRELAHHGLSISTSPKRKVVKRK